MTGARRAFVRKEIREILRDRRAVLLSFMLPIFIYPVTFSFMSFLERRGETRAEEAVHRVLITGEAPVVRAALEGEARLHVVEPVVGEDPETAVDTGNAGVWVDARPPASPDSLPVVELVYHGPHEESRDAHDRVRDALESARADEANRRLAAAGGSGSLDELVRLGELDVATEEETGGARAGQLIPFLLVMTLFIGGGALSTDLVAGEKERQTLETLYLTPVPRRHIATSKFLVVWGASVVTGALNLLSMLYCYRAGLITDATDAASVVVSAQGVVLAFLLIVPLGALVGGVLLGLSALARSLREAQMYLAPAMLLAMIPGLLATGQHMELGPVTSLVPIANVALAIRDGLLNQLSLTNFALVFLASVGWGWLATRWTTRILAREDTILGFDPEPFLSGTRDGRRRAAMLGMSASVLLYFYVGNLLQARDLIPGLVLSLWVVLPLLTVGVLRLAWSGGRLAEILSWRRPSPLALVGGALIGAGLVVPVHHGLFALQQLVLPAPGGFAEGMEGAFENLGPLALFLLVAVTPGITEEVAFRGAFLGLWRRVGSTRGAVLVSSAFFALIHLSVFRFLPTFAIGLLAAFLVVRTRSLFPAMVLHTVYNALNVLHEQLPAWVLARLEGDALGWGVSLALLAAGAALSRPPSGSSDEAAG